MTPDQMLQAADNLLATPPTATTRGNGSSNPIASTSSRARGAALLARMALEQAMTTALEPIAPDVASASARSQLMCLDLVVAASLARDVGDAYAGLSRACHAHAYELTPNAAELHTWISSVRQLIPTLEGQDEA